jgi:hypothetical protein
MGLSELSRGCARTNNSKVRCIDCSNEAGRHRRSGNVLRGPARPCQTQSVCQTLTYHTTFIYSLSRALLVVLGFLVLTYQIQVR